MTFEQELAARYKSAHDRLMGPVPETVKYIPPKPAAPPPNPASPPPELPKLSTQSPTFFGRPTFKQLTFWVAEREGVEAKYVLGPYKDRVSTDARKILYFLLHRYAGFNFPHIGRRLKRDHTTVISGFYKIKARIESDPDFAEHMRGYTDHIELQMETRDVCPLCGK